jgi:chromosome segregation ATPase
VINNITKSNENLEEIRKELKMKEDMIEQLQQKLNNIDNKINKIYNHKDYIILCDKYFKNLQWFLLTPKIKEKNNKKNNINDKNKNKINNNNNNIYTYENVFWVTKKNIEKEMSKYNDYVKENEEENKIIINYIKKLEEKENVISKLNLRLASLEKNINNKTSNNDKDKDLSKNRSRSSNNKPYTEIKYFEKEEKLSEDFKFTDKIDDCFNKGTTHGSGDDEKKYNNIEDELKANKKQIQLYEKVLEEFKNKIDKIKEFCNNYFSKTIITKYEKEDVRAILLLLDFNENDINFIINKKRK